MKQERAQRQTARTEDVEDSVSEGVQNAELAKSTEEALADIDDVLEDQADEELLADIDDVLEENAAEFVSAYVQQGGE